MSVLSIVVPVYNGEAYLNTFVDSVAPLLATGQVQLLFVNDGSTDQTGSLLNEMALHQPSIAVLHVPNGGQGRAKNIGARAAVGKFLWFVDVDDLVIVTSGPAFLLQFAEDTDLVLVGYERVDVDSGRALGQYLPATPGIDGTQEKIARFDVYGHSAWNKIVRRELYLQTGHAFLEGVIHEDLAVVPLWLSRARKITFDRQVRYRYGVRASSSIHGNFSRHPDLIVALSHLMANVDQDDARIGPSVIKELFFYSLPRYAGGLGKGCSWASYMQCYRDSMTMYRRIPAARRSRFTAQFSRASRIYIGATAAGCFFLPLAVSLAKRVRDARNA